MKTAKISLLCSAIALCFSSSVSAGSLLDQGHTPTTNLMRSDVGYFASQIPWLAQTFEVGMSGQLTAVDLLLSKLETVSWDEAVYGPLNVSMFSVANGKPSTPWVTTTLPSSSLGYAPNDGTWLNVDFSAQHLSVVSGDKLAIVVHRLGTATAYDNQIYYGGSWPISWYGSVVGDYVNGNAFQNSGSGSWNPLSQSTPGMDFGFRTYVAAVPEPETYAMLLAGLGLMGAVARRRKLAA